MAGSTGGIDRLAVLGVVETAVMALCEQQIRASLGETGSVDAIRSTVEAGVYWPEFLAAVQSAEVTERHPDLPGGPLRDLLVIWARQGASSGPETDR